MWFGLTQINWMKVLKVEKATNSIDKNLGEILWESFDQNEIRGTVAENHLQKRLN